MHRQLVLHQRLRQHLCKKKAIRNQYQRSYRLRLKRATEAAETGAASSSTGRDAACSRYIRPEVLHYTEAIVEDIQPRTWPCEDEQLPEVHEVLSPDRILKSNHQKTLLIRGLRRYFWCLGIEACNVTSFLETMHADLFRRLLATPLLVPERRWTMHVIAGVSAAIVALQEEKKKKAAMKTPFKAIKRLCQARLFACKQARQDSMEEKSGRDADALT